MSNDVFEMVVHHGGHFVNNEALKYIGNTSTWSCDPDRWSYFEVVDIVKQIGCVDIKELWYAIGLGSFLGKKFHLLCDDTGAMDMVHIGKRWGQVYLFVIHTIYAAEIVEILEYPVEDNVQDNCEGEGEGEGRVAVEVEVQGGVQGEVQGEDEVEGGVEGGVKGVSQVQVEVEVQVGEDVHGKSDVMEGSGEVEVLHEEHDDDVSVPCRSASRKRKKGKSKAGFD